MTTFTITEKQNLNSFRDGYEFAGSLAQAKRKASREQGFFDTVLTIEENNKMIAYKNGKSWVSC